jgi:hypothetical protein
MAEQILRDSKGHTIGKIYTANDGVQTIRDARGHIAGSYDPKSNATRDAKGHKIGTGNLLTTLL